MHRTGDHAWGIGIPAADIRVGYGAGDEPQEAAAAGVLVEPELLVVLVEPEPLSLPDFAAAAPVAHWLPAHPAGTMIVSSVHSRPDVAVRAPSR